MGLTWLDICKVNPLKRQVAVQRRIGIFVKNIKDAMRLKKKFNLRFQAARFRDTHNEEQSYEIAALFSHFTQDFQRLLSPAVWEDTQSRFFRGTLDAEFLEKVSIKDPAIRLELPLLRAARHYHIEAVVQRPAFRDRGHCHESKGAERADCRGGGWSPTCREPFTYNRSPSVASLHSADRTVRLMKMPTGGNRS